MAIYKVTEASGETWLLNADMVQAAAGISYDYWQEGEGWVSTPFQTAGARHNIDDAAVLVLHYIDRASCAEDSETGCDCAARIVSVDEIEADEIES